jgi:chromosome segregation ATPase
MSEEKERECKCEPHFEMPQEVMCSRCHEPLGEHYKPKDKEFAVPISEWNKLVDEKFTLKEQIKSLKSRLKEFQTTAYDRGIECNKLYNKCHDLESRLKAAENVLKMTQCDLVEANSRLKEAQKELERLYEFERSVTPQIKAINEERFQEVFKLKERLSQAETERIRIQEGFVRPMSNQIQDPKSYLNELEAKLKHQDERVKEWKQKWVDVSILYKNAWEERNSLEARVKELQSIVDGKCVPVGYYSDRQVADMEKKIKELETKLSSPATLGVETIEAIILNVTLSGKLWTHKQLAEAIHTALLKKVGV